MRTVLLFLALFISCFSFAQKKQQPNNFIRPIPKPVGAVNDFGAMLSLQERQTLEKELTRYRKATTNVIVILTIDSLPPDPKTKKKHTIEETALLYFNTWGIGDSIKNNGVLILLSRDDRQMRIEVGLGLGSVLTDQVCKRIITEQLVPSFKQQKFFTGLKNAIEALEKALDGDQQATAAVPGYALAGQFGHFEQFDPKWTSSFGQYIFTDYVCPVLTERHRWRKKDLYYRI